jgi:hypothetical protein
MAKELGTANAIISSITTLKDGSVKLSFEVNPEDQRLVNNLMNEYLNGEKLVTIAVVQSVE